MTTYTSIPNADIDQDSPVTQPLMTALRDNPIAITEGATGAPRIVAAAIEGGSSSTSGQVYYSEGDGTGLWGNAENIEATKDLTGTDGYVKLPGGIILQWGRISTSNDLPFTVNFSLTFPNACLNIVFSHERVSNTAYSGEIYDVTTAGFTFNRNDNIDGTSSHYWQAIGY